jgi:hypothetical protein
MRVRLRALALAGAVAVAGSAAAAACGSADNGGVIKPRTTVTAGPTAPPPTPSGS